MGAHRPEAQDATEAQSAGYDDQKRRPILEYVEMDRFADNSNLDRVLVKWTVSATALPAGPRKLAQRSATKSELL